MNISALNSNINASTSFGREYQIEEIEKVCELSKELSDSFNVKSKGSDTTDVEGDEKVEHKSALAITTSVLSAGLITYILGKSASTKVLDAFPKITDKLTNGMRKSANIVRDYADDVVKGTKLAKGGKWTKFAAEKIAKAEAFGRRTFVKLRDKSSAKDVITTAIGLASVATIAPDVVSIDGNKDGISDIAQKNVNAYKNAAQNIGIVSEMVQSLV